VKLPEPPPENPRWSRLPKSVLVIMVVILAAMALVSLYSNVQRWRRSKIETIIVTPAASPSSTP
jgi:magnesium-transporting ATPase (P-type)